MSSSFYFSELPAPSLFLNTEDSGASLFAWHSGHLQSGWLHLPTELWLVPKCVTTVGESGKESFLSLPFLVCNTIIHIYSVSRPVIQHTHTWLSTSSAFLQPLSNMSQAGYADWKASNWSLCAAAAVAAGAFRPRFQALSLENSRLPIEPAMLLNLWREMF